jgi:hypothetical protein
MRIGIAVATAAVAFAFGGSSIAQGMRPMPVIPQPTTSVRVVRCPEHVAVVLNPTTTAAGWMTNDTSVALSLDAKNPPRVESGRLICYYAMPDGYNAFVYFQSQGQQSCTVLDDKTGFECR